MSIGIKGLVVTFEENLNQEYVEELVKTLKQFKYVVNVEMAEEDISKDYFLKEQLKHKWILKVHKFINDELE